MKSKPAPALPPPSPLLSWAAPLPPPYLSRKSECSPHVSRSNATLAPSPPPPPTTAAGAAAEAPSSSLPGGAAASRLHEFFSKFLRSASIAESVNSSPPSVITTCADVDVDVGHGTYFRTRQRHEGTGAATEEVWAGKTIPSQEATQPECGATAREQTRSKRRRRPFLTPQDKTTAW